MVMGWVPSAFKILHRFTRVFPIVMPGHVSRLWGGSRCSLEGVPSKIPTSVG